MADSQFGGVGGEPGDLVVEGVGVADIQGAPVPAAAATVIERRAAATDPTAVGGAAVWADANDHGTGRIVKVDAFDDRLLQAEQAAPQF